MRWTSTGLSALAASATLSWGCDDTFRPAIETKDATEIEVGPVECLTTAPTSCPSPAPTYDDDIAPIIEARCLGCHFGALGGPWPLTDYGHVTDWRDLIRSVMLDCAMPPPEENIPITTEERMAILNWIRCGMPR